MSKNVNFPEDQGGTPLTYEKYHPIREAILTVLAENEVSLSFEDLTAAVKEQLKKQQIPEQLFPKEGSVIWYTKAVQLDLEANKLIERVPSSKPLRFRKVKKVGNETMISSPLTKKLQIKPNQRIVIINPPPGYMEELGPLPEGVELAEKPQPEGIFDLVHLFVKNSKELNRLAPTALKAVKYDGLLWISYPKRSSKVETDLTRDIGWEIIDRAGLEGVANVSINEVWSALRFRPTDRVGKKSNK